MPISYPRGLDSLRQWIGMREGHDPSGDNHRVSTDASSLQRYFCIDHGWVVPLAGKYACPYDYPNDDYLYPQILRRTN